ncbi:MAG: exonuclease SbcCD subunit D C-terminal domain-containing protein [Gammaproteobacteria bacterium]|nr:exonuclease SbcCD subunit D C-terminal domain-containing protein [Gammaproteobacteria bacterium]
MRCLHTSDWHLGRLLYGRRRDHEFDGFLAWLVQTIVREEIDICLVAGDIFDTGTPSNKAQAQYYRFLVDVSKTACQHVVIIGGNHDSPSFLDAPAGLLSALNVHVVAAADGPLQREVLSLKDQDGQAMATICAVPYLRDRDIRSVTLGESVEDKSQKLLEGIAEHYRQVAQLARTSHPENTPLIGMGHLFAAGGITQDGDGVRDLYVGNLAQIGGGLFAELFDYTALGHIHRPQIIGGHNTVRYCGAPIAMGFGETHYRKKVHVVEFKNTTATVRDIEIPSFQRLETIEGDWAEIEQQLERCIEDGDSVWAEVVYRAQEAVGDLRQRIGQIIEGSAVEVLRVRIQRKTATQSAMADQVQLAEIDHHDVFAQCMEHHQIDAGQRDSLKALYQEAVAALAESKL